jgi:hypothetical protein
MFGARDDIGGRDGDGGGGVYASASDSKFNELKLAQNRKKK